MSVWADAAQLLGAAHAGHSAPQHHQLFAFASIKLKLACHDNMRGGDLFGDASEAGKKGVVSRD